MKRSIYILINILALIAVGPSQPLQWKTHNLTGLVGHQPFTGLEYGNGVFVSVGSNDGHYLTSLDGINWVNRTGLKSGCFVDGCFTPGGLCFGNGQFVIIEGFYNYDTSGVSVDGVNWTFGNSIPEGISWSDVCYGNGLYVAVASATSGGVLLHRAATSINGLSWTIRSVTSSLNWRAVCYGDGVYVAVASNVNPTPFMYSINGINWNSASSSVYGFYSIAYGNGVFVALSNDSSAVSLDRGAHWQSYPLGGTFANTSIIFGNGRFVIGGDNKVAESTDGQTWTTTDNVYAGTLERIVFANNNFYAVDRNYHSIAYTVSLSSQCDTITIGTVNDACGGIPKLIGSVDDHCGTLLTY
jgi:hypothetical protein